MQEIKITYPLVKLNLVTTAVDIWKPVLDKDLIRIGVQAHTVAGQFANNFQKEVLNNGQYDQLLSYFNTKPWEIRQVEILFKNAKSIALKEITLSFDYLVQTHDKGFWIVVPALALEAFAAEESEIENGAREVIQMDFMRHKRLDFLQNILSVMWYGQPEVVLEAADLTVYTLSELDNLKKEETKRYLPFIAKEINIHKRVMYGNDAEINRLGEVLSSKYNRATLVVGKSGVGKTTLVWETIRRRQLWDLQQTFWETTASTLIKELTQSSGWQQGLAQVCKELRDKGDVLFVRNMLELFEVGQYEGNSVSMAEYLREFIARGELTLISECTDEEFARIEARSPNFTSLFNIIRLEEPQGQELVNIIQQKVRDIAFDKGVQIETEAILETVRLNHRYTPYSGFPGKPIRFLESILINAKHLVQQNEQYTLNRGAVIKAFCEDTGMPAFIVDPNISMDLDKVNDFFAENVFGQQKGIDTLMNILASIKTAVLRQGKPIASMLFVGPTGVGKTEMAKVLAEFMFGSRDKMIRFDMSEYSSPYAIMRLIGESYFSDGLLTSAVRREPFCVLLFDELEKAHPDFNDLLLQMLGEGRLTDTQGKIVNFCSTIIIMTSNIGASKLQMNNIGWDKAIKPQEIVDFFENEVRKFFRPEIFNRIDQIVPFYPLDATVIRHVVEREIALLCKREGILGRNLEWKLATEVLDYLGQRGYHPKYGARALQRALREELIIPLARKLNSYRFEEKIVVQITMQKGQIDIYIEADPLKVELMLEELTQTEYMDYASDLRRRINKLVEGNFYTQLISELTQLFKEQQRYPKDFWSDAEKARKLSYYDNLRERVEKESALIEEHEAEMALVSIGLQKLNTKLYDKIKAWDKSYFDLKLELLSLLQPESNQVMIGIYGSDCAQLLPIYQAIFNQKNLAWEARTVWYRESMYNEIVVIDPNKREESETYASNSDVYELEDNSKNDKEKPIKRAAKKYYYKDYKMDLKNPKDNFKPDEGKDKLLGIELRIMGRGVQWYLDGERGLHKIDIKDNQSAKLLVVVSEIEGYQTPEDIHRKNHSMWQGRPRRSLTEIEIEDIAYNIPKRRLSRTEQINLLVEKLDKFFSNRLDEELQGGTSSNDYEHTAF